MKRLVTLIVVTFIGFTVFPVHGAKLTMWIEGWMQGYETMIEEFERQNPGIEVQVQIQADYFNKLAVAAAAGVLPDVYQVNGPDVPAHAENGFLLPIDNVISPSIVDDWVPVSRAEAHWKGQLWAVPIETNATFLTYNIDVFAEAGLGSPDDNWTWDDLATHTMRLTRDRTGDGHIDVYGLMISPYGNDAGVWSNLPFIHMTGTGILDDEGQVVMDAGKAAEALTFLRELTTVYGAVPSRRFTEQWRNGTIAMRHDSASGLAYDMREFPDLNVGAAVMPKPWNGQWASGAGGWMMGVNAKTQYPEEAAQLIAFIASSESVQHLATKLDRAALPVRTSSWPWIKEEATFGDLKYLEMYPYDVVLQAMEYGVPRPRTTEWPRAMSILGTMLTRTWGSTDSTIGIAEETTAHLRALLE